MMQLSLNRHSGRDRHTINFKIKPALPKKGSTGIIHEIYSFLYPSTTRSTFPLSGLMTRPCTGTLLSNSGCS